MANPVHDPVLGIARVTWWTADPAFTHERAGQAGEGVDL
jgi:hypothetical protein